MKAKKHKEQPFTHEQYEAVYAEFTDQRAKIDDLYREARKAGDIAKCLDLYTYWRQIVAQQREFLLTHPTPRSV